MRWLIGALAVIALAWVTYVASPYWAAASFAADIRRGDVLAAAGRVNVHAIRLSLAKQFVSEGLGAGEMQDALGAADVQIAAGTIAAAADPLLAPLLSARGVVDLLRETPAGEDGPGRTSTPERLTGYLAASRWRGFRNVYFALPPDRPAEEQVRLQFRLSRLSWRLVSIDLPAATRKRIAERLLRLKPPKAR